MCCRRHSIAVPHFRRSRTRWHVLCIAMDVSLLLQHSQYALPVGIVLVCAILVFVFGFKKAEQPPFAQLSVSSDVDRKFANKKRSKIKEKVSRTEVSDSNCISLYFFRINWQCKCNSLYHSPSIWLLICREYLYTNTWLIISWHHWLKRVLFTIVLPNA